MKYFLNTLLYSSIILFTLGCIDEHDKKESLREQAKSELSQKSKVNTNLAQGISASAPKEVLD